MEPVAIFFGVAVAVISGIILHERKQRLDGHDKITRIEVRTEENEKRHDRLETSLVARLDKLDNKMDKVMEKLTNA